MSRRDVNNMYLQQQMLYLGMLDNAKEFDRMYKAGEISKERFEQAQKEVEKIRDNYLQISYFMLELQKPFKKRERKEWEKRNKVLYDSLEGYSREALLDESRDALADFRKMVEEEKANKGGNADGK